VKPFDLDSVDRLLTTTKAVRRRLDLTRPVPRHLITECIGLASYAPNASNGQEWRWVVVDDAGLRAQVGEQYRRTLVPSVTKMLESKVAAGDEAGARISRSILYLADRMGDVPVLVVPCYDKAAGLHRYQSLLGSSYTGTAEMDSAKYASIYPAVWGFQLALRSRGLASVLTTAHQSDQPAMARILDIPLDWDQAGLIPVAYPTGADFIPSPRRPPEDSIVWR
jgi:nitroreductase